MTEFTPLSAVIGGLIIGLSAALLWATNGRIAGISGIAGGLFKKTPLRDHLWRIAFVGGLLATGYVIALTFPSALESTVKRLPVVQVVAGLLVGVGTQLGSGCTSGHGVCGIGRLSGRSIVATLVFMTTAVLTVFATRYAWGGHL